jgi:hypothetical protein
MLKRLVLQYSHRAAEKGNVKVYCHEVTVIKLVVIRCLYFECSCSAVIEASKLRQTQSLKATACHNS